MIQRLQSIFYVLTGIFFGAEFAFPFASTPTNVSQGLFKDSLYNIQDNIALQVLAVIGVLLSIAALFMYRNRKNQIKTGYILATIAIILPIVAILIFTGQAEQLNNTEVSDELGLYLPIGMIVFSLLGVRYTKKDEQLVKSMDRLR